MQKTYDNWTSAIAELQVISFSLADSIGNKFATPAELREIEAINQSYYHNLPTSEDYDEFIANWVATSGNDYHTGSGLGFAWQVHDNNTVTVTLHPARNWHPNSRLLANAWGAGYRGELPFEYSNTQAYNVRQAVIVTQSLYNLLHTEPEFSVVVDAVANGTIANLMIATAQVHIAKQAVRQAIVDAYNSEGINEYDDDEALLGTSALEQLRQAKPVFAEDDE